MPALDGLRAIAVAVVVFSHFKVVAPMAEEILPGGFLGVDVFFVLSGFLITAILLGERISTGRIGFVPFCRRRAVRLLPAVMVLLAAHLLYVSMVGLPFDDARETVLAAALYHLNWAVVWNFTNSEGLGHLWSLSVEEQFYLVWPFAVLAMSASRRHHVRVKIGVLTALIAVVAVHRAVLWASGESFVYLYVRTDTRADALLVGALLACLWIHRLTPTGRFVRTGGVVAAAFLAWCFANATVTEGLLYRGGFTVIAVAVALVLLAVLDAPRVVTAVLGSRIATAIGRVSYGTYLWHLPVLYAVARFGRTWAPFERVAVSLVVTAAAVCASWFLIERPALRWNERRRSAPPTSGVTGILDEVVGPPVLPQGGAPA